MTVMRQPIIGGAFDGGTVISALIAGDLSVLVTGKNYIQIPAGTLAEVPLKAPLTIK